MANIGKIALSLILFAVATLVTTAWQGADNNSSDSTVSYFLQSVESPILAALEAPELNNEVNGVYIHPSGGENPENPFIFDPHSVRKTQNEFNTPIKSPFRRPRDGIRCG